MVDFTPQCNTGQDSIAISYIMDTFGPRKTLYGSIKKATWFLERLRNLLFLILFSIQFLSGIIPTQAVYPEMSVRSPVFGKTMTTCCPNRLLFYNTNIRYSVITKHPLYNSISSIPSKQSADRSVTIPFVPLWHDTGTVLWVRHPQYRLKHLRRFRFCQQTLQPLNRNILKFFQNRL